MTWNFPEDQIGKLEAMAVYINQLKTEIEQLKKQMSITPEAVLGTFGGGNLAISNSVGDGESVAQEKCFEVGNVVSGPITVGGSGSVEITSGATVTVQSPYGTVPAGRAVAIAKDIDTDVWYIIAAKCS